MSLLVVIASILVILACSKSSRACFNLEYEDISFSITTPKAIIAAIGRKLPAKKAPVVIAAFFKFVSEVEKAVVILLQIAVLAEAAVTPTVKVLKFRIRFFRAAPIAVPEVKALARSEELNNITAAVAAPNTCGSNPTDLVTWALNCIRLFNASANTTILSDISASPDATDISVKALDKRLILACKLSAYFCCSFHELPTELAAVFAALWAMEKLFIIALKRDNW
ncbi:hypothetical protein BN2127_JRS1_09464 [Bacillus cereus]|nr:hypothetical protein BN2127_JRS1_09464 [Bacillus cereus]